MARTQADIVAYHRGVKAAKLILTLRSAVPPVPVEVVERLTDTDRTEIARIAGVKPASGDTWAIVVAILRNPPPLDPFDGIAPDPQLRLVDGS